LRENIEVLDEEIATARKFAKPRKGSDSQVSLQWAKTLANLVELRNTTLEKAKLHLLGRDLEFGLPREPPAVYDRDPEISFERDFKNFLSPWKQTDLELECAECHKSNEDVQYRDMGSGYEDEYICSPCYEKFQSEQSKEEPATGDHAEGTSKA
jgi:hypothetical protein